MVRSVRSLSELQSRLVDCTLLGTFSAVRDPQEAVLQMAELHADVVGTSAGTNALNSLGNGNQEPDAVHTTRTPVVFQVSPQSALRTPNMNND